MKQFIRHIFLLVALFVATTNAWAEWPTYSGTTSISTGYVLDASGEVKININAEKEYALSGPGATLQFDARKGGTTTGPLRIDQYVDGVWKNGVLSIGNGSLNSSSFKTFSCTLNPRATKVRFYNEGTLNKVFKNVKVTLASYVGKTNLTTWTADTAMIGAADETKQVTVDWSNTSALTYTITGTGASQFSCAITNNASAGTYGTATITITYKHKEVNTHTATLILSNEETIPISGTTLEKYDAVLDWTIANVDNSTKGEYHVGDSVKLTAAYTLTNKTTDNAISLPVTFTIKTLSRSSIYQEDGDGNYDNDVLSIESGVLKAKNAGVATITASFAGNSEYKPFTKELTLTINKHDVNAFIIKSNAFWNEKIENAFYLSDDFAPFIVGASSDTKIATYDANANQIQTYFTSGIVTFQISRPENYKYKELKPTTLTLDVRTAGGCNVLATETDIQYEVGYNADPKEYWFDLEGTGDTLTVELKRQNDSYGYIHILGYDEKGGNETNLGSFARDDISTSWGDVKTCTIPKKEIRKILIKSGGHFTADALHKYFRNLKVTRKISLDPQVEDDIFYLSQSSAGMTFEGTFTLNWSTCAEEIRLKCDNPMFEITPSVISVDANSHGSTPITIRANATNATSLTGELTIYDQTQKKTITLSCEHLLQQIHWTQYFNNLEATEEGVANEKFILDAVAKDVNGNLTNQPINYTLHLTKNAENARVENGVLYITGVCEGSITASVEGFTEGNKTYSPDQLTHTIRVRKAGEPCNTEYILKDKIVLHTIQTSEALYVGDKNPDTLKYDAHKDVGMNYFYVQYSTDGSNWKEWENPDLPSDKDQSFEHKVPEGTTHIRFQTRTGATLNKYIKNIKVTQHTELKPDVTQIAETITVNTPFSKEIKVRYSDIPLIQSTLTQNTTKLLVLSPKQEVNNNCGDFGEYTYTLSGMWTTTQIVEEELRFFTIAGDEKIVNISIVVQTGAQIETQKDNGDWNDPSTWTNGMVPDASTPVHINHNVTISSPAEVYSILVEKEKQITITSTGGLTVHAGGYKTFNQEEDLEITIDTVHAGYFRMSPEAKTAKMPKAIVNFTTKGTLNSGGNDAAYQYIGAPGKGAATDILGTTVLYLRSEEKGWVRLKTFWAELEAFAGYALTQKTQPKFTFYPQLINEDKTIQLTYTSDGMQGDNLWANSYMAPLDITKFTPDDFTGNITATFYLYNSGSWKAWKDGMDKEESAGAGDTPGRYYAISVFSARSLGAEAQTVIPPMQGVYMKAGEGGGEIKLSYEKHVWNNTQTAQMNKPLRIAGRNESAEEQIPDFQRVRLQVTSENSGADRMYIIQDSLTTSGYDNGYDAPKQMADNLMNIYTNEPFGKMEISSTDNMNEMYIGFQAGDDSEYTMTFSSLIGDSLYLYDMEADEYIEMTENGKYQFSATPMSTNDLRFQLLVAPDLPDNAPEQGGDVATTIENLSTTKLWISDKMVYVTNVQPNSTLAIYGLGGICVAQYQIPEGMKNVQYPISNLPVGVYIIRLNDQACKFVCK